MDTRGLRHFASAASLWLAMSICAWPTDVHAVEISDRLSLHGFYSIDATLADGTDITFPSSASTPILLEDGEVRFDNSVIGVQADFTLTDRLRLTAQAVSSRQTDPDLAPTLEWAYLTYDLGHDLYLRGGRFKMPLLQGTELRHVGFARLWVRPLVPTSGAGGFDDYDGLELIRQQQLGDYSLRLQGAYGVADHHRDTVDSDDVKLVSARFERDRSWVNLALLHARYDVSTSDGRSIGEDAEALMGSIEGELTIDDVVVNAGYTLNDAEVIPDERMAYLSFGYRINRLTPYLLYQYRSMRFESLGGLSAGAPPPPPGAPPPQPAREGKLETRALSFGLRYDLGSTYAIKAQVERQSNHDDSFAGQPATESSPTVYSIVFEGVF